MTSLAELRAEIDSSVERDRLDAKRTGNFDRYRRDPVLWIDECVWIASKFADGQLVRIRPVKMRLYPDQREFLGAWVDLERLRKTGELEFGNVLLEKSRQVGGTWGLAAMVRWLLSYTSTRGLFMHTRAGEVADRAWSIDSFFGRIKYIDSRLGPADTHDVAPLIYRPFSHDPASIESPTGAMLRGECQRDDPGRGSSQDYAIVDEAAHVQHGESVHKAIDDAAVSGKLYLSTPEGEDNFHARLCNEQPEGWTYLRLHWSSHPIYGKGSHVAAMIDPETKAVLHEGKRGCKLCTANRKGVRWTARRPLAHRYPGKLTSPWYDKAVIGKTDEQVAAELDIDRAGALGSRVYHELSKEVHVVAEGIPYDPNLPLELAWDFGLDATSVPVLQPSPTEVRVIGLFEAGDLFASIATPDAVCSGLRAYLTSLGVPDELVLAPGSEQLRCIGDRAGKARSTQTGVSDIAAYRSRGFDIHTPQDSRVRVVDTSITSVKLLLAGQPKDLRICGVNGRQFVHHMQHNVWPMDAQGNRRVGSTAPLDNVHNHSMRAFAYWAVETHPPQGQGEALMSVPTGQTRPPRFRGSALPTVTDQRQGTRLRPGLRT